MLHEPAASTGRDPAFRYKKRLGVIMFVIYAAVYAGFVVVNLIRPTLMEVEVLGGLSPGGAKSASPGGLNLAVVYGFGLIVFALILALIYNRACGRREAAMAAAEEAKS